MATFKLMEETERYLTYWYFPNGDETKHHGVIIVDKEKETVVVTELAKDDFERDIPPEEMNNFIDAINTMRDEQGEADFVEYVKESSHSIFFGDHAVRRIIEGLNKGETPEKGSAAWY